MKKAHMQTNSNTNTNGKKILTDELSWLAVTNANDRFYDSMEKNIPNNTKR